MIISFQFLEGTSWILCPGFGPNPLFLTEDSNQGKRGLTYKMVFGGGGGGGGGEEFPMGSECFILLLPPKLGLA